MEAEAVCKYTAFTSLLLASEYGEMKQKLVVHKYEAKTNIGSTVLPVLEANCLHDSVPYSLQDCIAI